MNLQQLRYVRSLADWQSFSKAAAHCAVTQPTLSNAVSELEKALGHKIFVRTTRAVRLSEAGEYLLPFVTDILSAQAALLAGAQALTGPSQQPLKIGVSPVVSLKLVEAVIESFRDECPDAKIIFRELNLAEMLRLLSDGRLDFVFGPTDPHPVQGYQSAAFHEEPLVFVPRAGSHVTTSRNSAVRLTDIAEESFVMVPDACGLAQATRATFGAQNLKLKEYSGQAMSYRVLQEWADLGIGAAILPKSKLRAGSEAELPIIDQHGRAIMIGYRSLWLDRTDAPPYVQRLADFLGRIAQKMTKGLSTANI